MLNTCPVISLGEPADMDAVEAELATLEASINSAIHRRLYLIRLIDESGRWAQQGCKSCAHWLSWRLGIHSSTAREQVRVAKKLAELPRLDEELQHGRVTYSQVRAICRGATPASEEAFIEMAKNTTASQLERIVRGVEGTRALDEPDDASRAPSRWVFQRPMNDGSFRVEAQLRADEAARVMEAIRTMQEVMRQETRGTMDPADTASLPMPTLADALVRIAEHLEATLTQKPSSRSGADRACVIVHFAEDRLAALNAVASSAATSSAVTSSAATSSAVTSSAAMAAADSAEANASAAGTDGDAFGDSAEAGRSTMWVIGRDAPADSAGASTSEQTGPGRGARRDSAEASRSTSWVTDRDAPTDSAEASGVHPLEPVPDALAASGRARWAATLDDGSRISVETFRRIACDCSLIGVKHDADGDPLDVGRRTRTIPPALWRAIVLRDRGCAFPGCTNDRFLDGHHIEHWAQGGETKKSNLVCLCTFHHQLVHEGGFRVRTDEQGRAAFFDRAGQLVPTSGWTAPTETPLELLKPIQDRQVELAIDDETAYPMWDGSTPDYDLCVCAVLGVERRARQAEAERMARGGADGSVGGARDPALREPALTEPPAADVS